MGKLEQIRVEFSSIYRCILWVYQCSPPQRRSRPRDLDGELFKLAVVLLEDSVETTVSSSCGAFFRVGRVLEIQSSWTVDSVFTVEDEFGNSRLYESNAYSGIQLPGL